MCAYTGAYRTLNRWSLVIVGVTPPQPGGYPSVKGFVCPRAHRPSVVAAPGGRPREKRRFSLFPLALSVSLSLPPAVPALVRNDSPRSPSPLPRRSAPGPKSCARCELRLFSKLLRRDFSRDANNTLSLIKISFRCYLRYALSLSLERKRKREKESFLVGWKCKSLVER